MEISFRPVSKEDVQKFYFWRYEPPYDIYNEGGDLSDEELAYFLDPQIRCHAMFDGTNTLIAYCTFGADGQVPGGDYKADALDIGMGVRPDLTGQGKGVDYAQAAINFALDTYAPHALRVTIATFNERAQKVWQKAGFVEIDRFGREKDGMSFALFIR